MKKTRIKKIISLTGAVIIGCSAICGAPVSAKVIPDDGIVSPQYVAITSKSCTLSITSGEADCYGYTQVKTGYSAGTTVELQRYVGNDWVTIETWSKKKTYSSSIDEIYGVTKGYKYRLRVTHASYNSSGKLLEAITSYSRTVSY